MATDGRDLPRLKPQQRSSRSSESSRAPTRALRKQFPLLDSNLAEEQAVKSAVAPAMPLVSAPSTGSPSVSMPTSAPMPLKVSMLGRELSPGERKRVVCIDGVEFLLRPGPKDGEDGGGDSGSKAPMQSLWEALVLCVTGDWSPRDNLDPQSSLSELQPWVPPMPCSAPTDLLLRLETAEDWESLCSMEILGNLPGPTQTALPPLLGVSLACLRRFMFANDLPPETTVEKVAGMIKTLTTSTRTSVAHCLAAAGAHDLVGPLSIFVCHPRSGLFADLVSAIASHLESFEDASGQFFFIDLFCEASAHAAKGGSAERWAVCTRHAIEACKSACLVLTPWTAPLALRDLWCLFELGLCRQAGARLSIALPAKDQVAVHNCDWSVRTFDAVLTNLASVKSRDAKCAPADRVLHSLIQSGPLPHTDLDHEVSLLAQEWFVKECHKVLCRMPREMRAMEPLLDKTAKLLKDLKQLNAALPLLIESVQEKRRLLGCDHGDTLTAMSNLGLLFREHNDKEHNSKAEALLTEVLDRRRKTLGACASTLVALQHLASLYESTGRFEEAAALHREALGMSRGLDKTGTKSQRTFACLIATGQCLWELGRLGEAETLLSEALLFSKAKSGEEHVMTLNLMSRVRA